ncbi:MAG TPA: sigma-70 family RNA polymerase sigma factor, partial [Anaerolineales bacterium]
MTKPRPGSRDKAISGRFIEIVEDHGYLISEDILAADQGDKDASVNLASVLLSRDVEIIYEDEEEAPSPLVNNPRPEDDNESVLERISVDDTISLYLKEMSLTPLLTTEEEVELAKRIERGFQARIEFVQLNGHGKARRCRELEVLIQDGAAARDALIKANTRLVVSVARKYLGRGVPFLDLIQEGNLGLMRAVEKYEYRRGFRFSTYATWWIRQSISRAVADQSRTIRVPVHMSDRIRQIYKISQDLEQELGRSPTPQELAVKMDLDGAKVRWMLQVAQTPRSGRESSLSSS